MSETDKLLEAFLKLASQPFCPKLIADTLLVQVLQPRETKTKSGLIMATGGSRQVDGMEANRPHWVKVLMCGPGYYNPETDEDTPLYVKPGNIVLVGRLATSHLSTFGPIVCSPENQLALCREAEVRMKYETEDDFNRADCHLGTELGLL